MQKLQNSAFAEFWDCTPVSCFTNCLVPKPENSAKPNSRTVCRFPPWYAFLPLIPAVWGRKSHLLCNCLVPKLQKAALFAIVRRSFMEGSCIGFWKSKANSTFCKVVKQNYFLQSSQTKGRDVLAAFATLVCQRNCVFLCKGTKPENSAKPNSRTVCRFSPWNVFPPMKPAVWGFGLGLLVSQGFLCAKAPLDPPPYAVPSLFEIGILITEFSVS